MQRLTLHDRSEMTKKYNQSSSSVMDVQRLLTRELGYRYFAQVIPHTVKKLERGFTL